MRDFTKLPIPHNWGTPIWTLSQSLETDYVAQMTLASLFSWLPYRRKKATSHQPSKTAFAASPQGPKERLQPGSLALYSEDGWKALVTVLDDQSDDIRDRFVLRVEIPQNTMGWLRSPQAGQIFQAERDRRYAYPGMWHLDPNFGF